MTVTPAPSTVLRRRLLTRVVPLVAVELALALGIVIGLRSGASFGDVVPLLMGAVFLGLGLPVLMIDALRVAGPVTGRSGFAAGGTSGSTTGTDWSSSDGGWSSGGSDSWSDGGWSSGDSGCSSGDSGSSGGGADGGCGGSW